MFGWDQGFPGGLDGEESTRKCRRCRKIIWVRKIPWSRKWQPTAVFLPGNSHGQRSLEGYSPWGHKRVWHNLRTEQHLMHIVPRASQWETVILVSSAPILVPVGRRERRQGSENRGEGPCHSENLSIPGARPAHTTSSKQQTWNHLGRHHKKPPGDHCVKQRHDFIGIQLFKTNFLILTWNQLL